MRRVDGEGARDYRASLRAVREMLEQAGSASAVAASDLVVRRVDILAVAARQRAALAGMIGRGGTAGSGAGLSPDVEFLLDRLAAEAVVELVEAPTAVVVVAPAAPAGAAASQHLAAGA